MTLWTSRLRWGGWAGHAQKTPEHPGSFQGRAFIEFGVRAAGCGLLLTGWWGGPGQAPECCAQPEVATLPLGRGSVPAEELGEIVLYFP